MSSLNQLMKHSKGGVMNAINIKSFTITGKLRLGFDLRQSPDFSAYLNNIKDCCWCTQLGI
jgi:hypothetical protein